MLWQMVVANKGLVNSMKKTLMCSLALLLSQPALSNICPSQAPSTDGCTTKMVDKNGNTIQTAFIFSESLFVLSTFTSACNKHDLCYAKLGVDKAACDSTFRGDAKDICDSKFNKYLQPGENVFCRNQADVAYAVLRNIDAAWDHYDAAQEGSVRRNINLNASVQGEQCFTTPDRAGIYHSSLETYVKDTFQLLKGRTPSKFEIFSMLAIYGVDMSVSSWKSSVYSAVAQIGVTPPVAKARRQLSEGLYQQDGYQSQGAGLSYLWNINGETRFGPVYQKVYDPYPMLAQTYPFRGYLLVRDQYGGRDFDIVDDTLYVKGLCREDTRICSEIP